MPCLPRLAALTHGLEEGKQGGDAQSGGHYGEGTGRGVSDILIQVVDVWSHRGDHGGQARCLREVADDFTAWRVEEAAINRSIPNATTKQL